MKTQGGATLAITLMLLLVITLLGISTIQVTSMQEKMTANLQDKELSFRAAESALSAGETWLLNLTSEPAITTTCASWPCVQTRYANLNLLNQSLSWWQSNSATYNTTLDNVASAPRYFIEFLQFVPDSPAIGAGPTTSGVNYYQVTARGTGATDDAVSILQITVARRF